MRNPQHSLKIVEDGVSGAGVTHLRGTTVNIRHREWKCVMNLLLSRLGLGLKRMCDGYASDAPLGRAIRQDNYGLSNPPC